MCVAQEQEAGLNLDQKLLYILLHLQNWASAARDAMVQSYEPEKMWPRYYGAPGGVNRGGRFLFGIGHFNHGSISQEAFKIAVKCPNWPNFPRLRRAEKGFARVGLPKSRHSVTLSLTVRSPNTITPVS